MRARASAGARVLARSGLRRRQAVHSRELPLKRNVGTLGVLGAAVVLIAIGIVAWSPWRGEARPVDLWVIEVRGTGLDLGSVGHPDVVRRAERRGGVELGIAAAAEAVEVGLSHEEACPVEAARPSKQTPRVVVELKPWISVPDAVPQVGFDAPFEIEAQPGCRSALRGRVSWEQVSGAKLRDWRVEHNGWRLRARTATLVAARALPLPWGVVPFSSTTRGEAVVRATWTDGETRVARDVRVGAAVRASGLPSVGLGHRVWLGGEGWTVRERPPESRASPDLAAAQEGAPGGQRVAVPFLPDAPGRWELADASGATLSLRIGRHDETPLDCGRPECHASATRASASTPMTRTGLRRLPSCAAGCHSLGEAGLPDGGFAHVVRDHGLEVADFDGVAWNELPRALRRVGSVGCSGCHGPGAIPERTARWAIVRADVCAVCHDGPPRYGHVAAWRTTRMARSDDTAAKRTGDCARCHTTLGFLAIIGVRATPPENLPPEAAAPIGVTCAACHAPHGEHLERALVRRAPAPSGLDVPDAWRTASTSVCLHCHQDGAARSVLAEGSPHARVENGCLGCHSAGAESVRVERGAGHAFGVNRTSCVVAGCHASAPRELDLASRARALVAGIAGARLDVAEPPHAQPDALDAVSPPEWLGAMTLIANDRAAHAHMGRPARDLVETAESSRGQAP